MTLLNRLLEGKKRKTRLSLKDFRDIIKSCKCTTTTTGNYILQRKLCERGASGLQFFQHETVRFKGTASSCFS